jgi:hypothetical protein
MLHAFFNKQVDTLATNGVSLPGLTVEHVDLKARVFSASITRTVHVDMPTAASTSTQQQQQQDAATDDHDDDVQRRRPSALHRDVSMDLTLDADDNMTGMTWTLTYAMTSAIAYAMMCASDCSNLCQVCVQLYVALLYCYTFLLSRNVKI